VTVNKPSIFVAVKELVADLPAPEKKLLCHFPGCNLSTTGTETTPKLPLLRRISVPHGLGYSSIKMCLTSSLIDIAAFHKCKSYLLCFEFADKILIFAVLERRLLQ